MVEKFQRGRVFIAGDAAHLFTPTGGLGYNTAVEDAVNLGWKLAAVVNGWGGTALLDSYEVERRALAVRNTAFARGFADSVGLFVAPEELERALSLEMARRFTAIFRRLGFRYVTLDLEGYRQGSLNEVLKTRPPQSSSYPSAEKR